MRINRWAAGIATAAIIAGSAWGAGMFFGLPIVGGSSYCGGTSTGSTGSQVCTTTVPAGPSMSGIELFPADTQLSSGAPPQTVLVPNVMIGPGIISYIPGVDQTSLTVTANVGTIIFTNPNASPAGTSINKATLLMAASPADGQRLRISSAISINNFVLSANTGQVITITPTQLNPQQNTVTGFEYIWSSANSRWFRLQ